VPATLLAQTAGAPPMLEAGYFDAVAQTIARHLGPLMGDRGFESVSLQRRVERTVILTVR
jgi:metal-dependent amidase/aminoacylase/carboxypeptidase family protein